MVKEKLNKENKRESRKTKLKIKTNVSGGHKRVAERDKRRLDTMDMKN